MAQSPTRHAVSEIAREVAPRHRVDNRVRVTSVAEVEDVEHVP